MKKLLVLLFWASSAAAFPTKPVKIIVAFPPGGGTDIVARVVGAKLQEAWGQGVVVENRAGASGTIGTEVAAKSDPDGHTLFMANPTLPAANVREVIALAKKKPGDLAYSSSGPGGAPHLAMELFKRQAGIDLTHIPYKGSSMSINDLIGGRVMLTMDSLVQSAPHIKSGRLKALAVLGPKRSPLLPEVPTMQEAGVAGYSLTNWFGLLAPAATPREVVQKVFSDVKMVLEDPEIRKRIGDLGADVVGNTPEEFAAAMRAESQQWAEIIKAVGIKGE